MATTSRSSDLQIGDQADFAERADLTREAADAFAALSVFRTDAVCSSKGARMPSIADEVDIVRRTAFFRLSAELRCLLVEDRLPILQS